MRARAVVVALALLPACGDSGRDASPAEDDGAAPVGFDALDVEAVEAVVLGEPAGVLSVEPRRATALLDDGALQTSLTFTADIDVALGAFPYFADAVPADDGEGVLGVAGICGRAWWPDGTRVADDPCSAAEPVASVSAGEPTTLPLELYAATDEGAVRPGRYTVDVPLAGGAVRITYEVTG